MEARYELAGALMGSDRQGAADTLHGPDGESLYRACETSGHHHHLICRSCGATVEIAATPVEQWARSVAQQHGYTDAEHVVDIFGRCPECTARARAASGDGNRAR